jgi:putative DNA primase/helicase
MDVLVDFLKDRCIVTPESKTWSKDLYSAYTAWCEENGQKPVSSKAFGSGLREKGFNPVRFNGNRGWAGIELV